jgi:hypothetical protein
MADAIEAPAEQDQPTSAPEAPETDQPTGGEESFTDSYNPSELPDEVRPHVEAAYKQLQSAYTSKTQSLAEERREAEQAQQIIAALKNPQVAPAVLAQLGYDERKMLELYGYQPGEEESDEFADPDERIARLEQTLAQQQQAEQAQRQESAVTDYIAGEIEALEKKLGREFDEGEQKVLDAYARQFAKQTPDGRLVPDVEGAGQLLSGILSSHEKALLDPKRKAPRVPGNGGSGSRTVDLSTETKEERVARMAEAADAAIASTAQ